MSAHVTRGKEGKGLGIFSYLTNAKVELGAAIKEASALEQVLGNVEAGEETAGHVGGVVVGVALVAAAQLEILAADTTIEIISLIAKALGN